MTGSDTKGVRAARAELAWLQKFDEILRRQPANLAAEPCVRETIYSNLSIYYLQLIPSALLWI